MQLSKMKDVDCDKNITRTNTLCEKNAVLKCYERWYA
jgi:hypothetical protein